MECSSGLSRLLSNLKSWCIFSISFISCGTPKGFSVCPSASLFFSSRLAEFMHDIDEDRESVIRVSLPDGSAEETVIPLTLFQKLGSTALNFLEHWKPKSGNKFSLKGYSLEDFNRYCLFVLSESELPADGDLSKFLDLIHFFDYSGSFKGYRSLLCTRVMQKIADSGVLPFSEIMETIFKFAAIDVEVIVNPT